MEFHQYLEFLLTKLTSVCFCLLKQSIYMVKTSYEEQSQLNNKLEDHPIVYLGIDEDGEEKLFLNRFYRL